MLKSMTAYGRAESTADLGRFTVEIQCVNRKFLEIQTFLPKELWRFDVLVRSWVSAQLFRGLVNVRVQFAYDEHLPVTLKANLPLAKQYKEALEEMGRELGLEDPVTLKMMAKYHDLIQLSDNTEQEEAYESALNGAVSLALAEVMEMKRREGEALQRDMEGRLQRLHSLLEGIKVQVPEIKERYRQKTLKALEEMIPGGVHEERLLREVCLFVEKADIAEEVTRLHSHFDQFAAIMKEERSVCGKTLEFLVQEMQREVNTLGAKSGDVALSSAVVEMKSEIERIREQIQNVE